MACPKLVFRPPEPVRVSAINIHTATADLVPIGEIVSDPVDATCRREHCLISWSLANTLGISPGVEREDQVQIRVGPVEDQLRPGCGAVFTVAGIFWTFPLLQEIRFYPDLDGEMGGARRLYGGAMPTDARVKIWTRAPSVLHRRDFEEPSSPRRHFFAEPTVGTATESDSAFEESMERGAGKDVLLMAPYGGEIEVETDLQAEEARNFFISAQLVPNLWLCRGRGERATERWRVALRDLGIAAFPGLSALTAGRRHKFAVSFHGFDWAPGPGVILGGGASDRLKHLLQQQIERACESLGRGGEIATYLAYADGTGESLSNHRGDTLDGETARGHKGLEPANLVNRQRIARHGLQLTQSLALRRDRGLRRAVARAVAVTLYLDLFGPNPRETNSGSARG